MMLRVLLGRASAWILLSALQFTALRADILRNFTLLIFCGFNEFDFADFLVTYTFEILDAAGTSIEPGIGLIIIGSIRIVFAGK